MRGDNSENQAAEDGPGCSSVAEEQVGVSAKDLPKLATHRAVSAGQETIAAMTPHILIRWDVDYWFWRCIVRGRVEAFGGTDADPDPSIKPDADDVVRWAQEQGAEGLVMRRPTPGLRESTRLPLLAFGGPSLSGDVDALVLDVAEHGDLLREAVDAAQARGLECVIRVRDEDELEEVLKTVTRETDLALRFSEIQLLTMCRISCIARRAVGDRGK